MAYLGRPSAGDSPFAIGDKAMRDTSSPQPPQQRNPTPRQPPPQFGSMQAPSPYGSVSDEARRRYEERYAKKKAEEAAKAEQDRLAEERKQSGGLSPLPVPPVGQGGPQYGGYNQQQQQPHPPPQSQFRSPPPPQQHQFPPPGPQQGYNQQQPQQPPHQGGPPGGYPHQQQQQQQQQHLYGQRPPSVQRPPSGYQSPPPQHQQPPPPMQQRWSQPPPQQHQQPQQSLGQHRGPSPSPSLGSHGGPQWSQNAVPPPPQQWAQPQSPPLPQRVEDHELRNLFNQFDSSRSGQLNSYDLQRLLAKDETMEAREDCVKMLMNIFDTDRSGSINFMEFEGLYRYIQDWHGIFLRFDRDNSGLIDRKELHQALLGFGFSLPADMVRKLEKRFAPPPVPGQDKPKGIAFDRFLMACVTVKHFTESFRKTDTRGEGRVTMDYNQFMGMVLDSPS